MKSVETWQTVFEYIFRGSLARFNKRNYAGEKVVTINAVDARSFADLVERNPEAIVSTVSQSIRKHGKIYSDIRSYTK